MGPFSTGLQLQHGQVIQDAVLHLFQIVVIFVQNLGRALHVHLRARGDVPGQVGHPLQVGARHAVFRRCRRHARQPVQLAHGLGLHFFGHAGGFQLFAQFLDIALRIVALAQFLLDGLQLLAQIELALALRKLALHLRLDLPAQFEQFQFARQVAVDLVQARAASVCSSNAWRSAWLSAGRLPATKSASRPGSGM